MMRSLSLLTVFRPGDDCHLSGQFGCISFRQDRSIVNRSGDIEVLAATRTSSGNMLRLKVSQFALAACWLGTALSPTASPTVAQNVPGKDVAGCSRDIIGMMVSPDDSRVAFVQEEVCSDGAFQTTILDYVQLVRRGVEPTRENDIFAVEEHGVAKYRPLLQWLSSHELQITVPNKSLIGLRKSRYEAIEVVVKFNPDNPVERERFLKENGLSPD